MATIVLLTTALATTTLADWTQWRGPNRNGAADSSPPLADHWPDGGPVALWDSEPIPVREEGGLSSVVVAHGRAYLYVIWHEDQPIPTRTLRERDLRSLGWEPKLPDEVSAKIEKARTSAERHRQRGSRVRKWAEQWADENLVDDQAKRYRGYARRRLEDGDDAFPLDVYAKLLAIKDKQFATEADLDRWLAGQKIADKLVPHIKKVIATTVKVAADVVVCIDTQTGKTQWKARFEGLPVRHQASSTPCIVGDRLYVAGSTHVYCINAQTGKAIWKTPVNARGTPSSFAVVDDVAVIMLNQLAAFDAKTGMPMWSQKEVRGNESSPVAWMAGGRTFVICNTGRDHVACVDVKTGDIAWTAPGGGIATCAVEGDTLVVHSRQEKLGLVAYRMTPKGVRQIWSIPFKGRGASSPVIHDRHVYLIGADQHLCVELATGKVAWQQQAKGDISSPLVADNKVFALQGNGGYAVMLDASPKAYKQLAKARVRAEWCPSPAYADGKLFVRTREGVRCYDLTGKIPHAR